MQAKQLEDFLQQTAFEYCIDIDTVRSIWRKGEEDFYKNLEEELEYLSNQ